MKIRSTLAVISLAFFTSCNNFNIFGPVDNPGGDTQVLAYARACLNQGNFTCALENYAKLTTVFADVQKSEQAMTILNQQGITMGAFSNAFGTGSRNTTGGTAISKLAGAIMSGAGASRRTEIGRAAFYAASISNSSSSLKHMTRFLVGLAMFAAVLSEDTSSSTGFSQADLVTTPSTCVTGPGAQCNGPAGKNIVSGSASPIGGSGANNLDVITLSNYQTELGGAPSLAMIDAAVNTVANAITFLDTSGTGLGSITQSLTSALSALDPDAAGSPLYRRAMLINGIGL
jgi:hypothetical protein